MRRRNRGGGRKGEGELKCREDIEEETGKTRKAETQEEEGMGRENILRYRGRKKK